MKRIFSVAVLFLFACALIHAQTPVQVDQKTQSEHLLNHPQADFPPIAYAAHVYGTVVIAVTIDGSHLVSSRCQRPSNVAAGCAGCNRAVYLDALSSE
jgi:hypothetical protein